MKWEPVAIIVCPSNFVNESVLDMIEPTSGDSVMRQNQEELLLLTESEEESRKM